MKDAILVFVFVFCTLPAFAQGSGTATYYNPNGSYGGSARTTTTHYNANGAPAVTSTTTTFGNQTMTTHYNQYGQPAGTTTRYNFGR